jgi:hypothetical protein
MGSQATARLYKDIDYVNYNTISCNALLEPIAQELLNFDFSLSRTRKGHAFE